MKKIILTVLTFACLATSFLAHAGSITVSALDSYGPEGDHKKCPINVGNLFIHNRPASDEECDNGYTITLLAGKTLGNIGVVFSDNSAECGARVTLTKHNTLTGNDSLVGMVDSQNGNNLTLAVLPVNDSLLPGEVFVAQSNIYTFNYTAGLQCKIHGFSYQF